MIEKYESPMEYIERRLNEDGWANPYGGIMRDTLRDVKTELQKAIREIETKQKETADMLEAYYAFNFTLEVLRGKQS